MRFLKFLFLAVLAVFALLVAIANRRPVELHAWPAELPLPEPMAAWPHVFEVPLYLALLGAVFVGLAIGILLELVRERRHRRDERRFRAEAARLHAENRALRARLGETDLDDDLDLDVLRLAKG